MNSIVKSPIISCSRRTDIPALQMNWVLDRMRTGCVEVTNPFNRKQKYRISLKPSDVRCWVWWSKNFKPWIEAYHRKPGFFKAYKGHYFQFTINSPSELEKGITITLEDRLKQLGWLIEEFGLPGVNYRFDPIIFYRKANSREIKNNLDKFEFIISNVATLGIKEMIFSFATIYPKVMNRMRARGYLPIELDVRKKKEILRNLLPICKNHNIEVSACCQPELIGFQGIHQAHCIDANKIENIIKEPLQKMRDSGQRKDCGCHQSKDIGGYTGIFKCQHNCAYCYASPAKK
jgi:hypothetical protein